MKKNFSKYFYVKYIIALLICIIYFIFNLRYIQRFLDLDQIVYIRNIMTIIYNPKYPVIFNPHHIHLEITGKYFNGIFSSLFGRYGLTDLTFNLRIKSLLFSCIGIFSLVVFLIKITGRHILGILGILPVIFCHGYLHYSTKVDTAIFPVSWLFVILWIMYEFFESKNKIFVSVLIGLSLFIGIMFHQYMIITAFAVILAVLLPDFLFPETRTKEFISFMDNNKKIINRSILQRYAGGIIIFFIAGLLTAGVYFYIGRIYYNLPFYKDENRISRGIYKNLTFQKWIFSYATTNKWGNGLRRFNPKIPFRGLTDAFLTQGSNSQKCNLNQNFRTDFTNPFDKEAFVHNQVFFFVIAVIILLFFLLPEMWIKYGRNLFIIFFSLILYSIFFIYWEPYYFEFWLIPCSLLIIIGIMELNLICEKLRFIFNGALNILIYSYLIFIVSILFIYNFVNYMKPYSSNKYSELTEIWDDNNNESKYMDLFSDKMYKNKNYPYIKK